jgi:predicted nucleic acid-binding protein
VRIGDVLRHVGRIGIDTSALIGYAEEVPGVVSVVAKMFERTRQGDLLIVCSTVLYAELLPGHPSTAQCLQAAQALDIRALAPSVAVAQRAAEYREWYGLRTPDALHLATAVLSGCTAFLTGDGDFSRAGGIEVSPGQALRVIDARKFGT